MLASFFLVASMVIGVWTPRASATTAPFSPLTRFEIDGNMDGTYDWNSLYKAPYTTSEGHQSSGIVLDTTATDPCGGGDTTMVSKETSKLSDYPWKVGTGEPNKKADLCKSGAAMEVVQVDGQYQYVFYGMWTRDPDGTGDLTVYYRLQTSTGEILIEFDYNPAGNQTLINVLRWNGTSWMRTSLPTSQFQAMVGKNPDSATAQPGTFGEFAVNLTTSNVLDPSQSCTVDVLGTISRTGNSDQAELQDIMFFDEPAFNICNNITVTKKTMPANTPGGPFTVLLKQADGMPVKGTQTSLTADLTVPDTASVTWSDVIGSPDYMLSETSMPDGWELEHIKCTYTDLAGVTHTDVDVTDPEAMFAIPPSSVADPVTCTVTNSTSALIVKKSGTGDPNAVFEYDITGVDPSPTLKLGEQTDPYPFKPGTPVTVTENLPTTGLPWEVTSIVCTTEDGTKVAEAPDTSHSVSVETIAGKTITCEFTNTEQSADLKLVKAWWEAKAGDAVELSIDGSAPVTVTAPTEGQTTKKVALGTDITLSEAFVAGDAANYTTTLTCDNGVTPTLGADNRSGTINLPSTLVGKQVTCTFLNQRKSADLSVVKKWVNGATGDMAELKVSGTTATGSWSRSNQWTVGQEQDPLTVTVYAGDTVTVSETLADANAGSYASSVQCTGMEAVEGTTTDYTMSSDPKDVTCTFTNTRLTQNVELQKAWEKAIPGDTVVLTIEGQESGKMDSASSTAPTPMTDDAWTDSANKATIEAFTGEKVDLSEVVKTSGQPYSTMLECTAGELTWTTGATNGVLTVPKEAVTTPIVCTFTNKAPRGTIVIVKSVEGADGTFTFEGNWTGMLEGTQASADQFTIGTDGGTGSMTWTDVPAGSYTVTETDPGAQYDFTKLVCTDPDGETVVDGLTGTIDLDADETVTCVYTNTEKSTITIIKDAQPDYPADFAFTATGDPLDASFTLTDDGEGAGGNTYSKLVPAHGTYTVTEEAMEHWNLTDVTCVGGTTEVDGATVTIKPNPGEPVTCTYTNVADPASLELTKKVEGVPAERAWAFDITLTELPDGTPMVQKAEGTGPGSDTVKFEDLTLGSMYTLAELDTKGYTEGELMCEGITDADADTPGLQFKAVPGLKVTCSLTNTWIPPVLTLDKVAHPVDGDKTEGINPGDTITWTFLVTNESELPMVDVHIVDSTLEKMGVTVTCPKDELAPGESMTCTSDTYVVTLADALAGVVHNQAIAIGTVPPDVPDTPGTEVPSNEDETDTPVKPLPGSIVLVKTAWFDDTDKAAVQAKPGDWIYWRFEVMNQGPADISDLKIDDPMLADMGIDGVDCDKVALKAGETAVCETTDAYQVSDADAKAGFVKNVATAKGKTPDDKEVTSTDDAKVVVMKPIVPPAPPAPPAPKPLPQTGTPDVTIPTGLALGAMVLGFMAIAAGRRRQQ